MRIQFRNSEEPQRGSRNGQSDYRKYSPASVRTIVSVVGIALGVCLIMLFTGLATGMSNDLQRRNSNHKS